MSGSPAADVLCGAMCLLRRPLTALAPRAARRVSPDVPAQVARAAVSHVWPAYRDALTSLLDANPLNGWLIAPTLPTTLVLAERDDTVPAADLVRLLGPAVSTVRLDGTHLLPIERPEQVAGVIEATSRNTIGTEPSVRQPTLRRE